jgi:hypothetical protein
VVLDNIGVGRNWPSGATQDRRAWVEIRAFKGGRLLYQSGVVADGAEVEATPNDPDLWLIRDCIFDANKNPVDMFWQAANTSTNQLPGPKVPPSDPRSLLTHVPWAFAAMTGTAAAGLPDLPDRVTMGVRLQPIGLSVLDDLVKSNDLDPTIPPKMATYTLADTNLVWTATSAMDARTQENDRVTCVATPNYNIALPLEALPQTISHLKCAAK